MFFQLVTQMAKDDGLTEALKRQDQMLWVQRMNNIRNRAEEVVLSEFVHNKISARRGLLPASLMFFILFALIWKPSD